MIETLPETRIAQTAEQWVMKALGSKGFCKFLHVNAGRMIATDRHRLHWAPTVFPDGMYTRDFMPADYAGDVPNFEPFLSAVSADGVTLEEMYIGYEGAKNLEYARVPDGPAVRLQYLADAMNGRRDCVLLNNLTSLNGVSEFGNFIIAPFSDKKRD